MRRRFIIRFGDAQETRDTGGFFDGLAKSPISALRITPRQSTYWRTLHSSGFASRISRFFRNRPKHDCLRTHFFFHAQENEQTLELE
jgi:hypothetical protein